MILQVVRDTNLCHSKIKTHFSRQRRLSFGATVHGVSVILASQHITDRVSTGGNAIVSVRLSVRLFPLIFRTDLIIACVWVTNMARRGLKLKVTGQGQDAVGLTSILDRGEFSSPVSIHLFPTNHPERFINPF